MIPSCRRYGSHRAPSFLTPSVLYLFSFLSHPCVHLASFPLPFLQLRLLQRFRLHPPPQLFSSLSSHSHYWSCCYLSHSRTEPRCSLYWTHVSALHPALYEPRSSQPTPSSSDAPKCFLRQAHYPIPRHPAVLRRSSRWFASDQPPEWSPTLSLDPRVIITKFSRPSPPNAIFLLCPLSVGITVVSTYTSQQEGPGFQHWQSQVLSVWSLHVLPVFAWVSARNHRGMTKQKAHRDMSPTLSLHPRVPRRSSLFVIPFGPRSSPCHRPPSSLSWPPSSPPYTILIQSRTLSTIQIKLLFIPFKGCGLG
ncbi:uncharacterized protein LOC121912161 [Thunnus maccoyii]|uniref:uncharacterized protein LOC121912161 n=1 Tax=Thunnus maccoyii TaxID=8240 RepID=UPI001C4D0C80|nr:uncharacterized protein LOC121912161 [Thunnus maccoyii]